jgi:hypothetical protein
MKVTKKSKKVKVKFTVIESYISSYECSTCKVIFQGGGPSSNVLKFKCNCGQILEVESVHDRS